MSCTRIRTLLTGYLDGELEADDGSVVRGHLRECAACRQAATDESALRDGLRQLPPVDPPPSLWAGVQAQLAAAEVADAKRPAWRRALARWAPVAPRFATGGLVAAAAVAVVWWRTQRTVDDAQVPAPEVAITAPSPEVEPKVVPPPSSPAGDVTAELAGEAARTTDTYADAAEELLALATEARVQWTTEQKDAFDARVAELRGLIDRAPEGRSRQRAWGKLIKYLQGAVVRDDIALAGGGL
ncbi:MAG: zf-HC2 domain-containing protein [Deltaproteobacteria bacterium]|nr:zf-HC2 domain-containing protein [Deltaproteobacteria bacterium]